MTTTRSTIRWGLTGFVALAALVALGAVGAPVQADPQENPFAGSWSGTWTVAEAGVDGTFDWTISDAGQLSGRVCIIGADCGAIVGHVGEDGSLMFVGFAPADDPLLGNGAPFQGTAAIDSDGKLVVWATRTDTDRTLVAVLERN